MDRPADAISHPGHGSERVGARAKMGPFAKLFNRVPLLLQRIRFWIGPAMNDDLRGMNLGGLLLPARSLHFSSDSDAAARRKLFHFRFIIRQLRVGNDLDVGEAGAIVQLKKTKTALGISPCANPALEDSSATDRFRLARVDDGKLLDFVLSWH